MPSPITEADFQLTNFSGDLCEQLSQLLALNSRMKEFFSWAFDSGGSVTQNFKNEFISIGAPVGSVLWMPVNTTPAGWLTANGQAVSRVTYVALFNLYGTNHGNGDGVTTFNLPNLSGKFLMGTAGTHQVGSTGGAETVALTAAQNGPHTHVFDIGGIAAVSSSFNGRFGGKTPSEVTTPYPTSTESSGDGEAHENLPPYQAGLWLCKY